MGREHAGKSKGSSVIPVTGVSVTATPNTGTVGTAINSQVNVEVAPSNATGVTYTYALSNTGSAGLTVSTTGKITGTPTTAGLCTCTVTSHQTGAASKTGTVNLNISAAQVTTPVQAVKAPVAPAAK